MIRSIFFVIALFVYCNCKAQEFFDTLQVSKKYKTILIFSENISESIIGNDLGFIAELPRSEGSRFHGRIMKLYYDVLATEKQNYTNHTVVTDSGDVYDFILELTEHPKKLTWYIRPEMAVENINGDSIKAPRSTPTLIQEPKIFSVKNDNSTVNAKIDPDKSKDNPEVMATKELYESDPIEYFRLRCYYMQFDKAKISRYFTRLDNVFLWLKGVYYNEDELYFQFRVENKEGLDLDINFLKFHIATTYRNSSSNQRLELTPIYVFKQPRTVAGKSENHFVIVFKKFALDEKKEFIVELDEASGNRNISLKIGHEIINNPIQF